MINELRIKGQAKIPTEKAVVNRPAIKAYELGREIIIDSNVMIWNLPGAFTAFTITARGTHAEGQ